MVADVVMCNRCGYIRYHCRCRKLGLPPPEPPHMRIGDHGETVDPRTGFRSPPPTTEWRRAPNASCKVCIFTAGVLAGTLLTFWLQGLT